MSEEVEIWKPAPGWEGCYEISDGGRVKSLARVIMRCDGTPNPIREKIKAFWMTVGYPAVCLRKDGIMKIVLVHRLVAEAFIPNPNNLKTVNHKNGIKTDNRVENLEWASLSDNIKHQWKNGLAKIARGVDRKARLTDAIVRDLRARYPNETYKELAQAYEVSPSTVEHAISRRTWRHIK